jgi:arylsulfatase A-like enzyme
MKKIIPSVLLTGALFSAHATEKPNIIVILADDMGFSDLGCFGSEINTPNLDNLAANGLRFTQFYNSGRSCPTRASLLTGLHPHQAGMGHMAGNANANFENDSYRGNLNDRCVTFAEVLKPAGYFTAMAGKWHVGSTGPALRGFNRSYEAMGFYYLNDDDGAHKVNIDGIATTNGGDPDPANWYSSYKWAEWGNKYINEAITQQKPFFLYLSFNAPHFPIAAPDSVVKKYIGKYSAGWSELRKTRYARQKELGIIDDTFVLTPDDDAWTKWSSLTAKQKAQQDSIMATYAACVDLMDQSIGRVIANLKAKGVFENTLIVFMSDNGGNAEGLKTGLGNNSGTSYIGSAKSNIHCGGAWANAQNTPFREYKHYIHEGGIRTSCIAHWPQGISAKGEFRSQPAHVMDIMPTIVDVSGASYPTTFNGKAITAMQGTSLVPAFSNQLLNRNTLYWEHEANRGIRIGNMKCVAKVDPIRVFLQSDHQKWELYDLSSDPTETKNLAISQSETLTQMRTQWESWANQKSVLPWPWGNYTETNYLLNQLYALKIFADPSNQTIHVTGVDGIRKLTLRTMTGILIFESYRTLNIPITDVDRGVYLLTIETLNNKKINSKILIQ